MGKSSGSETVPEFAVIITDNNRVDISIRGRITVKVVTADGEMTRTPGPMATWSQEGIMDTSSIDVYVEGSEPFTPLLPLYIGIAGVCGLRIGGDEEPYSDHVSDLVDSGIHVIGASVEDAQRAPEPFEVASDEEIVHFDESDEEVIPFSPVPSTDSQPIPFNKEPPSSPPGAPQPMVWARVCTVCQTPNSTRLEVCRGCQSALEGDGVHIPRPSLGKIQISNGDVYSLEHPLRIGRKPEAFGYSKDDEPLMIKVDDPHVSATHLRIDFRDWNVIITNQGRNGTVLRRPGEPDRRFTDQEHVVAQVGDVFYLSSELSVSIIELT
ncbi:MAG: FHA domain-containing protein [Propionibacteriaceae bacterium]|nr:FHA domain-containing protein [Propionibacteriaceae bacterium]